MSTQPRVPARIAITHEGQQFFICPNDRSRALSCGQRVNLFPSKEAIEPTHQIPGALLQIAQIPVIEAKLGTAKRRVKAKAKRAAA